MKGAGMVLTNKDYYNFLDSRVSVRGIVDEEVAVQELDDAFGMEETEAKEIYHLWIREP